MNKENFCKCLIHENFNSYTRLRRKQKKPFVQQIVNAIEARGGRFLNRVNGEFIEVTDQEIKIEKVQQAIRDFKRHRENPLVLTFWV